MADLAPAVSGDIGDHRIIALDGIANLNAVTAVAAHVYLGSNQPTHVALLAAAVEDAAACTIRVELGAADGWLATAEPGTYRVEYQLTFANGDVLTWPAPPGDRLSVRADADPPTP